MEGLVVDFPRSSEFKTNLGAHYVSRGSSNIEKDLESALHWGDKAVQLLTQASKDEPQNPRLRLELAKAHALRTSTLYQLNRYDEAQRASQRALALDSALTKDPSVAMRLTWLPFAVRQQLVPALTLARNGKVVEAAEASNRIVESRLLGSLRAFAATNVLTGVGTLAVARELAGREGAVGETHYNAACVMARCARQVEKRDPAMAEAYSTRAVTLLARARDEGFFATLSGRKLLETDDDFILLRKRKDFQQLLAAVRPPDAAAQR
jgi:hypothetical protein